MVCARRGERCSITDRMTPLNAEELGSSLASLPSWRVVDGGLRAEFVVESYEAGVGLAMEIAALAQRMDHHPDALTIGWQRVAVVYVTHSANGITRLDLDAAGRVNKIAARVGAKGVTP